MLDHLLDPAPVCEPNCGLVHGVSSNHVPSPCGCIPVIIGIVHYQPMVLLLYITNYNDEQHGEKWVSTVGINHCSSFFAATNRPDGLLGPPRYIVNWPCRHGVATLSGWTYHPSINDIGILQIPILWSRVRLRWSTFHVYPISFFLNLRGWLSKSVHGYIMLYYWNMTTTSNFFNKPAEHENGMFNLVPSRVGKWQVNTLNTNTFWEII